MNYSHDDKLWYAGDELKLNCDFSEYKKLTSAYFQAEFIDSQYRTGCENTTVDLMFPLIPGGVFERSSTLEECGGGKSTIYNLSISTSVILTQNMSTANFSCAGKEDRREGLQYSEKIFIKYIRGEHL